MPNIDLDTLLKHYTEGRISKKEFVHLHSLITQSQKQVNGKRQPAASQSMVSTRQGHSRSGAKPGLFSFVKSHYRSVTAFMGSLWIFLTLAANYYHGLSLPFLDSGPAADSGQNAAMVRQISPHKPQPRPEPKKDIKTLAESLLNRPIWEAHAINELTRQWAVLSAQQKDSAKKTAWFDALLSTLKKQIKFELARRNDGGKTVEIENRRRALMQLAVSLDMVSNTPTSLASLGEMLSPTPPAWPEPRAEIPQEPKPKVESRPKPTTITNTAKQLKDAADAEFRREVRDVIDQYVAAFEKGDSKQMLALFAADGKLQQPLTLETLQTQYTNLFDHSKERWVEFRGLAWETQHQEIRGKGKFRTSLRFSPSGDYKTLTTDVAIVIRKIDNVTRITGFELEDNSIFSLADTLVQKRPVKRLPKKAAPKHPTQSELDNVITQYVDSYQSGDIDGLMKLFASGNWTAGPSGLKELRRDYTELFNTTSNRQVVISNMDWTFKGNKAMGTGDLVINLVSKEDYKISRKQGKVRLIVEKNKDARISHLFNIVN